MARKPRLTWITGAVCFLGSVGTAFTGYLIQTNFDSQWISTQAKDGLNSVGIGSRFNVLNFGQMLMWHIVLLPRWSASSSSSTSCRCAGAVSSHRLTSVPVDAARRGARP